jgi:hypothetical protein
MSKKARSFLKKRTKKLLILSPARNDWTAQDIKVFCFFSSEKKTFLGFVP